MPLDEKIDRYRVQGHKGLYRNIQRGDRLTLIRAAGGVYDLKNFEEIYLCNGSSSEFQNSCVT
jgi:hypothetical protein